MTHIEHPAAYRAAIQHRILVNASRGRSARWLAGADDRAELAEWLRGAGYGSRPGSFLAKMADSLDDWGSLTERQEAAVRKVRADREVKNTERAVANAAKAAKSVHVGKVGERQVFGALKVERLSGFEGSFGYVSVTKFEGPNGEVISHLGSRPFHPDGAELKVGEVIVLQATVKAHKEYQGIKETQVSRPKVLYRDELVEVDVGDATGRLWQSTIVANRIIHRATRSPPVNLEAIA